MQSLKLKTQTISFLFSILFLASHLSAQVTDPLRVKLSTVFQNINKSQIPSQFLAEYAHPILPMQAFDGTLVDSIRTDINVWRQLYATTFTAYLGSGAHPMPELSSINTTIASVQNAIPISLLHWNFNDMRPDAITANLLSISNDQLNDVVGRSQNPYQSKTLFVAAPSVSYSDNANITFVLRADLFIKNTGAINAVYIDLADGVGYQQVTLGTPLSISYSNAGIKRMKIKVVPAIGSIMESWFDFQVNTAVCPTCRYIPIANQTIPINATAAHSGGTYFVRFSSTNNTSPRRIQRPLIIAEGFDPNFVAPLLSGGNYTLRNFINAIDATRFTQFDFNAALDEIAGGGYDLVFIDYNNGTDDITRNAALLQDVIRMVNTQKQAGDQQNVVMGISMGGLVARYGLAQMVRNSENPQTRLLITHDSPHRGANVPLGAQYLGQFVHALSIQASVIAGTYNIGIGDILAYPRQLNALLNAPATSQLLALRATSATTSQANTFLAPGGAYRTMVDNITLPYQTIATSDGSQCGNQLFAPGTNLVQFDAGYFIAPLTKWITSGGLYTSLTINAALNQQQNQALNFRLYTQYKIFTIPINITIASLIGNSPATALALDGAPGGTYPKSLLPPIPSLNKSFDIWLFGYNLNLNVAPEFCFVPTASALDVTNFNASSLAEKYVNSVNTSNASNFTRYIAQESFTRQNQAGTLFNQEHVAFTPRNSHWLFDQMENVTPSTNQECSSECTSSGLALTGNALICTTGTYSVNSTAGTPVTWSVSPSGIASLSSNGNTATLTRITNGNVTLTALVGSCITLNQNVQVGVTIPNFAIIENTTPCPVPIRGEYSISPVTANTTYSWVRAFL